MAENEAFRLRDMASSCATNNDTEVNVIKVSALPIGRFRKWRICRTMEKQYDEQIHGSASSFAEERRR